MLGPIWKILVDNEEGRIIDEEAEIEILKITNNYKIIVIKEGEENERKI